MIDIIPAIYKLYPQVTNTRDNDAFDKDGNPVQYDLAAVTAKAQEDEKAAKTAKESAQTKLAKLGLTADEIKALVG